MQQKRGARASGTPIELVVDGQAQRAYDGETVAAALWRQRLPLMRSLKYHRARAMFCGEGHCGGCLMRIDGQPNIRACMTAARDGMEIATQNAKLVAEGDALGLLDAVFAHGLDHHGLMTSHAWLNRAANRVVRALSGQGELPTASDGVQAVERGAAERGAMAEQLHCQVCVVGSGPAGLAAAIALARGGVGRVVVIDDQAVLGGSYHTDLRYGEAEAERARAEAAAAGVEARAGTCLVGMYERAHLPPGEPARLYALATTTAQVVRIEATAWIFATGGYSQNLLFGDNDRPGVIAARAAARLLHQGVAVGERVVVATEPTVHGEAEALAAALRSGGASVELVPCDRVAAAAGPQLGAGAGWVTHVEGKHGEAWECDALCVAAVPSPASEGARMIGCHAVWSPQQGGFALVVDDVGACSVPRVFACGDVTGFVGVEAARRDGARVGAEVAAWLREGSPAPLSHVARGEVLP